MCFWLNWLLLTIRILLDGNVFIQWLKWFNIIVLWLNWFMIFFIGTWELNSFLLVIFFLLWLNRFKCLRLWIRCIIILHRRLPAALVLSFNCKTSLLLVLMNDVGMRVILCLMLIKIVVSWDQDSFLLIIFIIMNWAFPTFYFMMWTILTLWSGIYFNILCSIHLSSCLFDLLFQFNDFICYFTKTILISQLLLFSQFVYLLLT